MTHSTCIKINEKTSAAQSSMCITGFSSKMAPKGPLEDHGNDRLRWAAQLRDWNLIPSSTCR